jgi:hypothetical protein
LYLAASRRTEGRVAFVAAYALVVLGCARQRTLAIPANSAVPPFEVQRRVAPPVGSLGTSPTGNPAPHRSITPPFEGARTDENRIESSRNLSAMAFHEKTGPSQVDFCGSWNIIVLSPSSRCRHASIRTLEERCVSLGASWAFSVQPVLLSVWRPVVLLFQSGTWARPLTQSPELGFGLVSFLFLERFLFCFCLSLYAAVATVVRLLLCNGS